MTTIGSRQAAYDIDRIRAQVPALADGTAYFDGPGGSQTPEPVARAIYETLTAPLANRGLATAAERNAEQTVLEARSAVADLLGATPGGVFFGRSMTHNTFELSRALAKTWESGDEIVVSSLDHDANVRPWVIAAAARGVTVRFAELDPLTGELDPAAVEQVLGPRTRLVAVTAASNLIGTMPDVRAIADRVHAVGALLHVDGVHATAHVPIDVVALGADFFACSPYKFLGPHCGATWGRPEALERLAPDKLLPSTDALPERFELGTLPYELLAGTAAAVGFLADLIPPAAPAAPSSVAPASVGATAPVTPATGLTAPAGASRRERIVASMTALEAYEDALRRRLEQALFELPGATVHSRAARRTPTLLVTIDGVDLQALRAHLAARRINAPVGSFYAYEPARRLGLGAEGGMRFGLAPYTSEEDVDRLVGALQEYPPFRA
ncbi:Cysteine desulfurase family protein [Nostocoides japonicum T1-X7]|uniref:Cysteine desulfurase family protein n=1 Tax=Nostocoides japonicum T1-X7 TaxID=1194083 RepID=A0A077M3F0_9MICO|nr:aminotransferase class V-fold PLP-dependent enzyme [Tetrasphaera japonica]CCH79587.1 Cysteine desulfurase family protein [Tetrasphaera japonica T1-X7]